MLGGNLWSLLYGDVSVMMANRAGSYFPKGGIGTVSNELLGGGGGLN